MPNLISRCFALCIGMLLVVISLSAQTGSPFGVCAHAQKDPEWPQIDNELLKCQQAGIKWLRVDIQFSRVCAVAGQYEFTRYDSLLLKCQQYGIQWLPILQGFDSEISKGRPDMVPLYNHLPEWRAFVRTVVSRYHSHTKYWEIWNEQDGGFWKPNPNAAQYVPLLKASYEEIKAIDTGCTVMVGGLTGWNADYLRSMYAAGAKGYFDKIAVHPYGYGTDKSARIIRLRNDFYTVLQQNGQANMPIWITESGGSSFVAATIQKQPQFAVKAIKYALQKLGKDTTTFKVGIAVSPRIVNLDEVETWRSWLPGITLVPIPFADLATVDPDEFPVILGSETTSVDQPMLEPLRNYVIRGGLMLAVNILPFYYTNVQNADGTWTSTSGQGYNYPFFRIGYEASWTKPGVPATTTNIAVTPDALAGGVPTLTNVLVDRFISPKNLQPTDTYHPIIRCFNSSNVNVGEAMSLFTYGDWKGGILMGTAALTGGYTTAEQANLLQRVYLNYLSLGVEKICWYDLHSDNGLPGDKEGNFGLLKWDFSPKPAYNSYKEMTGYLGAEPRFLKRISATNTDIWALAFQKREDSTKILAVWSADSAASYQVLHRDSVMGTWKGNKVYFLPLADSVNAYKVVTPGILQMDSIGMKTYGEADFVLRAASSNPMLPVTFSNRNTAVAKVYKDTTAGLWKVKILGAGADTLVASQWDLNHYPTADSAQRALVVNPAVLNVTPEDTSKLYGRANPFFTVYYTGFMYEDDTTVIIRRPDLHSTATQWSVPGRYPITATGATARNYTFQYHTGTLRVDAAPAPAKNSSLFSLFLGSNTVVATVLTPYEGKALFEIVDLTGRRAFAQNISLHKGINRLQFQVQDFVKGFYVAVVSTALWSLTCKMIK
ncbi:hypothetical protein SAMN04488128_105483 [Chitinophaga eiseniae]|uniref:MBG domain-containing protein n=1 Tax=Chitinophaga eiseniae TaxID=634771 RepID=A0A1T4TMS0_9BACT|nr:MBG domain-containing protein [Chitinophaga eiseniae]SKA41628.1 hypothetical protein SAMN04488128_105483 [Chitinophaga eiseniae]